MGITWEMIKATTHVVTVLVRSVLVALRSLLTRELDSRRMSAHTPQPTTVWLLTCRLLFLKTRKKTKRLDTLAYSTPRKMSVGIMKEKEIFLYTSDSEPKAGAVMY